MPQSTTAGLFHIRRYFPKYLKRIAMLNIAIRSNRLNIKVCKYVTKGNDMAKFGIAASNKNDEVSQYQIGRYVSSNEEVQRIFSFSLRERHPTLVYLVVHLENGQRVYRFTTENAAPRAERPPVTTLTSFFKTCASDQFSTLLYSEMSKYFTLNASYKKFQCRKQRESVPGYVNVYSTDTSGCIYRKNDECFYLLLLLINVCGLTSFGFLRMINGDLCATYREAR